MKEKLEKLEKVKNLVENKAYSPLKAVKIVGVKIEEYNEYLKKEKEIEIKKPEEVKEEVKKEIKEENKKEKKSKKNNK